jgi:hypothetical protein
VSEAENRNSISFQDFLGRTFYLQCPRAKSEEEEQAMVLKTLAGIEAAYTLQFCDKKILKDNKKGEFREQVERLEALMVL